MAKTIFVIYATISTIVLVFSNALLGFFFFLPIVLPPFHDLIILHVRVKVKLFEKKMKEFAKKFYKSKIWQRARQSYAASVGWLCEECLHKGMVTPGEIVHHKIFLTPENIGNPAVTLAFENLELLCRDCHAAKHESEAKRENRRFLVDSSGKIIQYK